MTWRTVAAPAVAVVVAAVALVVSGCGTQSDPTRAQVATYVRQVTAIERDLVAPLKTVSRVSVQAASAQRGTAKRDPGAGTQPRRGDGPAQIRSSARRLRAAAALIQAQGRRLRTLRAPPAATKLRSLLLALTAGEVRLTHQVSLLISFLPRFSAAMAPLGPRLQALEQALSNNRARGAAAVAAGYRAKAAALRSFQSAANATATSVRRLVPPAASRPAYLAQLASLRGMAASAGRLAAALDRPVPGNVRPLLIAFDRAALHPRALPVQRAEIAAVRAYDAQVRQLSTLAGEIAQERERFAAKLR